MPGREPLSEKDIELTLLSYSMGIGDRIRNQCLFTLELATGARVFEIMSLKRKDVIDDFGRIRNKITFTKTKNKRPRTVDLVNDLPIHFLEPWIIRQEKQGYLKGNNYLFHSRITSKAISTRHVYRIYTTAWKELELDGLYGTHSLRKTWARDTFTYYKKLADQGENINPMLMLKDAGGWETYEATTKYMKFMQMDNKECQKQLYPNLRKKFTLNK